MVQDLGVVLEVTIRGRFNDHRIGPQFKSVPNVFVGIGSSKQNDGQRLEAGRLAQPLKDFEPVFPWHFEVQENEAGQRELLALAVRTSAGEVVDGRLAVFEPHQIPIQFGGLGGVVKEFFVAKVILDVEDGRPPWIHGTVSSLTAGNSSQKRLPTPDVDSTPMVPSIRCIPLRAIGSPMPVLELFS